MTLLSTISEIDVWRAAQQMIEIYGEDAGWQAALRADHLLEEGDSGGFNVWVRIVKSIKALQQDMPSASDPKN
jgi:hypothetical protein